MIDLQKIIKETHSLEDELMRENGRLDKELKRIAHRKKQIAMQCSKVTLYRNRMINLLKDD
jgi:hypothetical protein